METKESIIEIPKGKIVNWEESQKQNKIVLEDKQLTYDDVCKKLFEDKDIFYTVTDGIIHSDPCSEIKDCVCHKNNATSKHQLECLLAKNMLANVAKYLNDGWKPDSGDRVYYLTCHGSFGNELGELSVGEYGFGAVANLIIFKTQKDAEQAIEILGEKIVKLALEPLGI